MGKFKFTPEKKIEIIKAFQARTVGKSQLKEVYGMSPGEIYRWISKYEANGISALARRPYHAAYSKVSADYLVRFPIGNRSLKISFSATKTLAIMVPVQHLVNRQKGAHHGN